MNGSQPLLEAWKNRAETRRQLIAQALAQKPANATRAALRAQYLQNLQTAVNNRKGWAQAYAAHLQALAQTVGTGAAPGSAGTSTARGSLGD